MNQDPGEAVRQGKLRRDLHYRLRVFPIEIPPLRQRPEDIPVLAQHYLDQFWQHHRKKDLPRPTLSDDAIKDLQKRPWLGNVRELRNVMEHTIVILPAGSDTVHADILPFVDAEDYGEGSAVRSGHYPLHEDYHSARELVLQDFEKTYLRHIVRQANGNLSDAARVAAVDRTTLYRLMEKHEIRKEDLLRSDGD
jgi:transcriptional regulator with PAS, ATPase and Fis domain